MCQFPSLHRGHSLVQMEHAEDAGASTLPRTRILYCYRGPGTAFKVLHARACRTQE